MMIRCVLLLASVLFSAPAFWTQKSTGSNPVAPFTLSRLDTTIAPQVHDTADSVRAYARARISDSLAGYLPLSAGSGNALTGELYASQGVRVGSNMLLRDLVGVTGFGAVYGATNPATSSNYLLAFQADASEAYFNATSKIGLDILGNDMVLATSSGVTLAGATTLSALGAGFVRANSAGLLSSSTLAAGDIPALDASKITTGAFPDSRIASAATWNAKEPAIVAGTSSQVWLGTKTWGQVADAQVASGAAIAWSKISKTGAVPSDIGAQPAGFYQPLEDQRLSTTNTVTFSDVAAKSSQPAMSFYASGAASASRNWKWIASSGGILGLSLQNDAGTGGAWAMTISRSGGTATGTTIYGGLTLDGFGVGVVRSSSAGLLSSSALTYSDLTGTVPTWNQSTTGSAAKWTTARTLTIGSTGKAVDGSADVSWSLAEIGAQVAGTYLTPSNVSGTSGQVAVFNGTNSVTSDAGFTRGTSSGETVTAQIGSGSIAATSYLAIKAPSNQYKLIAFRDASANRWWMLSHPDASYRIQAYDASGTSIDYPINIANASGGTMALGGGGRPINLTSGSTLQHNGTTVLNTSRAITNVTGVSSTNAITTTGSFQISGTDAITSERAFRGASESIFANGTYADPQVGVSRDAKFGGLGISTASLNVANLTASRMVATDASKNLVSTSFANDGPWLPLAGGTLSGSLGLTGSANLAVQALVGLSTRVATINSSGQLGVASYDANGPWLPQAGGVVTGMLQADGGIRLPHLRVTGNTTLSGPGIVSVNATCTVTLPTPSVSNLGWVIWINSTGAYTVTINAVSGSIIGFTPGITNVGRQMFQVVQTGTSTYAWQCN